MAVENDADFKRLAQFAKDHPDHPRRAEIIAQLRDYDKLRQSRNVETPEKPTEFGRRVLDSANSGPVYPDGSEGLRNQVNQAISTADGDSPLFGAEPIPPDDGLAPIKVDASKIYGPQREQGGKLTNQDLENAGVIPRLSTPNDSNGPRSVDRVREDAEDIKQTFGPPLSQALGGLKGTADVGLSLATTAASSAAGGFSAALAWPFVGTDKARSLLDASIDLGTYTPKSEAGRAVAEGISVPMEAVDNAAKEVSYRLAMGNPELATAIYTGLNAIPFERGATALRGRFAQGKMVKDLQNFYQARGIDLGSEDLTSAMQRWAQKDFADVPRERGASMQKLPQDIRERSDAMQTRISNTDAAVRNSEGSLAMTGIQRATQGIVKHIVENFPESVAQSDGVTSALQELNALERVELANRKKPNAAGNYRPLQHLNRVRSRINETAMNANAKTAILSGLDNFINGQIEKDLVRGDSALKGNTQLAAELRARYKRQFETDNVILRMATGQDASPEVFRKYILGLSESGFKTEAADVVRRLKEIFGEDAPQINAIRLEFLSDAIEPLRGVNGGKPDVDAFIAHHENVTRNNPSLIRELSPYMHRELDQMYRLAVQHRNTGGRVPFTINPIRMGTRIIFGHSIARHGAAQQTIATLVERFFGRSESKVRRELTESILREQSGDPNFKLDAPMFLNHTTKLQGLYTGIVQREYDENKDK